MTANELIEYGRKYIKHGTSYGKGMQLHTLTAKNLDAKSNQYPDWYTNPKENSFVRFGAKSGCANWKDYLTKNGKKYATDCCGWVKKFSYNGKSYDAKKDVPISEMASSCVNVVTDISKAKVGSLMWNDTFGHVAIYTGNGMCIESAPSCDGLVEHDVTYQGRNYWKYFGELPYITYEHVTKTSETINPLKVGEKVKLQTNSPVYGTAKKFASWVYRTKLYVRSINGNRVVVSTLKTGAVTGAVDVKYIERGNNK